MALNSDEINSPKKRGINWKEVVRHIFADTDDYGAVKWWCVRDITSLATEVSDLTANINAVRQWLARKTKKGCFRSVKRHQDGSGRLILYYYPLLALKKEFGFKVQLITQEGTSLIVRK